MYVFRALSIAPCRLGLDRALMIDAHVSTALRSNAILYEEARVLVGLETN